MYCYDIVKKCHLWTKEVGLKELCARYLAASGDSSVQKVHRNVNRPKATQVFSPWKKESVAGFSAALVNVIWFLHLPGDL